MHNVFIDTYCADPSALLLGTRGSYGIEQIQFSFGPCWEGLDKIATFRAGTPDAVDAVIPATGVIDVPHEATNTAGRGHALVVRGMSGGVSLYTCNIQYTVLDRGETGGERTQPPTPDALQQYIDATHDDRIAAEGAAEAAGEHAVVAEEAADDAWEAAGHYPVIRNGTWWIWIASPDPESSGTYIDTGQPARGPIGQTVAMTNSEIDDIFNH